MWRNLIVILTSIFCLSWAEVKVEKVLETTSIKEYNQWVKKNKAKYPGLRPYLVRTEGSKIYYYNEDGKIVKKELLKAKPGWDIWTFDLSNQLNFPYQEVVLVCESDLSLGEGCPINHTIKDTKGNKLFSFSWGSDYSMGTGVMFLPNGIGIFRSWYEPDLQKCYGELLTWDGKIIGKIENLCQITPDSKATPNNKYIALLTDGTVVYLENGKELWRKTFPSAIEVGISDDGQYVCIGDAGSAYVYNRNGDSLYSYCFSPYGMSNPMSKFSLDNKFLALSVPMELALVDNETRQVIWRKKVDGDIYKRQIFFASDDKYILLAYLGRVYICDIGGDFLETIREPNSNNWEVNNNILLINIRGENDLHKVIYKLK